METYIHTLIAADPVFAPLQFQVERFFGLLTEQFHFQTISNQPYQSGIRLLKPSGQVRCGTNTFTGETIAVPRLDQTAIQQIADIASQVDTLTEYNVRASGEWTPEFRPFVLLTTDRNPHHGPYLCETSCHVSPELVSTSCWNKFLNPNGPTVPQFGQPCKTNSSVGIFSHPWTGEAIEVPDAACTRFWIEFEFGRFLLPKMCESLNVLDRALLASIEDCFATRLVQGWRFW
jgi:hypothetical protein